VSLEYNGVPNFNVAYIAPFNVTASGVTAAAATLCTSAVTNAGGGWYRVSATFTSGAGPFTPATNPFILSRITGASGVTVLMTDSQLEVSATPTAYQNVVSQYNVTEAGVPSVFYLQFDGVDDFFVTPTITPGTDKSQVFVGLRKLSDAATGMVVETSNNFNSFSGAVAIQAPNGTLPRYSFTSRGTGIATAVTGNSYTAPITNVLTGIGEIATDTSILRVNGVQIVSSATDQGTGDYLAYPMYIGRRAGTLLPFNGYLYSLIVRFGPTMAPETIASTEAWVNSKTGAY